jgi:hypothetical protein
MIINLFKKIYLFNFFIVCVTCFGKSPDTYASQLHFTNGYCSDSSSDKYSDNYPGNNFKNFLRNHVTYGIRTTQSSYNNNHSSHSKYDNYNSYIAYMSVFDFQQVFQLISNQYEILNNYELYRYPSFCDFARTLSCYNEFILSLQEKIMSDKNFKASTVCVPGFTYSPGWRSEKSGFHDFVNSEANNIRNNQAIAQARQQKVIVERKGALRISDSQSLNLLATNCAQKIYDMPPGNTNERLVERINAINETRSNSDKCFDYSSQVSHVSSVDPDAKAFQNRYGTYLDCQLHKELWQTRNTMRDIENAYSNDPHVQILAPVVYRYTTQAKNEQCPLVAFELSDFCYTVTQVLANGMDILYDASSAISKGVVRSAHTFVSPEHWKGMATGAVQLGLLFADAVGQEDALHYAVVLAATSENSGAVATAAEHYCLHTQVQKDAINRCAQETYKKIQVMSWQEILENGTEIGTTMILDTLALNVVNGFSRSTSNLVVKELQSALESGVLFTEQYAVEVAGFGKLIVEEGAEISTKAVGFIKNDLTLFTQNNKNISHIAPCLETIASNIHKNFKQLIRSANVIIKGNNTAAGRAFQKHATREGSVFVGEITGNAAKNTEQAIKYIDKIIKSPESSFVIRNTKSYGDVLDIRLPDGMGARWTFDGNAFIGFLEKYTVK